MRFPTYLAATAALSLTILAGCFGYPAASPTLTATATPTATATLSPTVSPTPTPGCSADLVLRQVDELLAGQIFEAHYLTVNQELTLSVWLVDPKIDPSASEESLVTNNRQALDWGLTVMAQIVEQLPCVRQVFDSINPMIVDSRYQTWYIDFIPIRAFPESSDLSLDEVTKLLERSKASSASRRRDPPWQEKRQAPADACSWPEARTAIRRHFGTRRRNAAAYLLISDPLSAQSPWNDYASTNCVVQAQWDISKNDETDEAVILDHLGHMAEALACLWPPIDLLEVFIVAPSGQTVIYGMVPGALIRERVIPLPSEKILLHSMLQDERP